MGNLNVPDNDLVLMRYSDALLMGSDCKKGSGSGSAAIMTSLATSWFYACSNFGWYIC
jgi:hypothetical protein